MTSRLSSPNRRTRRIVVATTIAALVLGLGSWGWPRVDRRFVGKWEIITVGERSQLFELDRDGYVRDPKESLPRHGRDVLADIRRFVRDNQLVYFHPGWTTETADFVNRLRSHFEFISARAFFRQPSLTVMWSYDILEVTDSTIRLSDSNGGTEKMRRVSKRCTRLR